MNGKDLEKMYKYRNPSCDYCYFNQEGICKFNNELIKESSKCDYFIGKDFILKQTIDVVIEAKKIKEMFEKPDFQEKIDTFYKRNQELKEENKSFDEHFEKLQENFNELFDGVNVFGRVKEEIIELLKEFALPLIAMYADNKGKIYYADYKAYVDFCKNVGIQPIIAEEKFNLIRKLYEYDNIKYSKDFRGAINDE